MWKSDKPVLSFLKNSKGLFKVALLITCGVLLLCLGSGVFSGTDTSSQTATTNSITEDVTELCESIDGVGKCHVYITFSKGETTIYEGSHAVGVAPPKALAVTVVCEGADREDVRATLIKMLSSLLDLGTNRVTVEKMK